ncbi:MAG: hypothetical protein P8173_17860 [Gammaproteobacteria bacterium]
MLLFIKTKTVFGIYLLFYCKISMPSQCNIQGKYFPDRPNREENHMNTYAWVKPACYGAAGGAVALNKLGALDSWDRKSHLMKAGWATFPGGAQPDSDVAQACAKLLSTTYKLK